MLKIVDDLSSRISEIEGKVNKEGFCTRVKNFFKNFEKICWQIAYINAILNKHRESNKK